MGFPDPAVSTDFMHQLLSAIPNIVDDERYIPCNLGFVIPFAVGHHPPGHKGMLVGERHGGYLELLARKQPHKPEPL
ncbi:hypothetical protein K3M67_19600 (plasmid) [Sphingobium sp. V4]|uniref:hypothetical protein n=1 Tax=Sphingobium sp. V4 TaxID=3038927 RepID=UPI002557CEA2|nr:hypothetical protein [Sphingobium sp. V4]WIW90254.1 hypothetical protein K3M67_19600 [Sphingobium sp. V4]